MKKWFRLISVNIRNTIIVIIVLEFFLSLLFQHRDEKRQQENVDFKLASGVYQNVDDEIVRDLFTEQYRVDSEWAPYVHYRLKEFNGTYQNVNSNGSRKTINLNLKNTENALKIFCFGGSTIFGTGARDEFSIPSLLSKYIYKNYPNRNIEITNFGCHGYIRNIENIQLQLEILNNNIPDIVIFYDGVNEIISAQENNKAGYPTNASYRKNEFKTGTSYAKKISFLYASSNIKRFITYLQRKVFKKKTTEVTTLGNLPQEIATQYTRSIKITKALSAEYDFEVYNFLQPVIFLDKPLSEYEKLMAKKSTYLKELYLDSYKYILQNNELKKDSTFINISAIFEQNSTQIYTDFCHIAERGNDSIAKRIFNTIRPSF
ncbi:SGNH/GDSL hydrolase family protein [Aquimarina sp. 2201CG14-23]|uniref:SGNH/GDSL hydrolase family protein n=1 Tax=Aquimarina mycalae TaxID=3040073 RepID=UPI0024781E47|nr:SGNH/GDSL hydrolase family protein [Aquimarina sp. 2201CG14-23]MDH7448042.1 SGNH/GDSL hydrolase family protein [Aquimarina sp. 2201CG14-23]